MRITDKEYEIALESLRYALDAGATAAKVCLNKSVMSTYSVLDKEFDKLVHSADRSLYFHIFADGRYGNFSTNRFDPEELKSFLKSSVETVRMLAPDEARGLPDPELYYKGKTSGDEMGTDDPGFDTVSPEEKRSMAMECAEAIKEDTVSSEIEFSDQEDGTLIADTQGFTGLNYETTYAVSSEITVKGKGHSRASGYYWDASPMLGSLRYKDCAAKALERAKSRLDPRKIKSGKYNLVVENTVSSKLFAPIIMALHGMAIQQHNSFLTGTLGKQVFPEWLSITDRPHVKGAPGSRLFDSEGVATKDCDIIHNGTVGMYFINSYASRKLGMPQTVESPSRPSVVAFDRTVSQQNRQCTDNGESTLPPDTEQCLSRLLKRLGSGILVTGFNGGNSNPVTGAFSFGIEGFRFENGEILYPVSEMLITGDILSLWAKSLFAGNDPLRGTRWRIPTLAFGDVDFNG